MISKLVFPIHKRDTGGNEPTTAEFLCLFPQEECMPRFDFAQVKASEELCINKLSDAAAKSELKANCETFDSKLGNLGTLDDLSDSCVSSVMAFLKGAE